MRWNEYEIDSIRIEGEWNEAIRGYTNENEVDGSNGKNEMNEREHAWRDRER